MNLKAKLTALAPRVVPVPLPGTGVDGAYVRVISSSTCEMYENGLIGADGKHDRTDTTMRARLIVLTACEADGTRVFDDTPEDLAAAAAMDSDIGRRLFDEARKLNRIGKLEEDAKNSSTTPPASSA